MTDTIAGHIKITVNQL